MELMTTLKDIAYVKNTCTELVTNCSTFEYMNEWELLSDC
jgi:hypothetical protein